MLLVPTDFSSQSLHAVKGALKLASLLQEEAMVIYAFSDPLTGMASPTTDELSVVNKEMEQVATMEMLHGESDRLMTQLAEHLREEIAHENLPPVRFKTQVDQGIAEDVILSASKQLKPSLIVMGTRGAGQKAADLIGSVTAEVMDNSTFPVLSIPGDIPHFTSQLPQKVALIGEKGTGLVDTLKFLKNLFPEKRFEITIINLITRNSPSGPEKENFLKGFQSLFPEYSFNLISIGLKNLLSGFDSIQTEEKFEFLLLPSRRKNFFSRLFNPGPAHRLLFHTDLPMLVYPLVSK